MKKNEPVFRTLPKSVRFLIIVFCAIFVILVIIGAIWIWFERHPVAQVGDEPIVRKELALYLEKNRSMVYSAYQEKYDGEYSQKFWDTELDGEKPIEILKETALKELARDKMIQIWAKELGVVDKIDYGSFRKYFEEENLRRRNAIRAGEVIYGPEQYGEADYYSYWMDQLLLRSQEILRNTVWQASEQDLKDYYEQNKDQRFRTVESIKIEWIAVEEKDFLDREELLKKAAEECQGASNQEDLEAIRLKYPDILFTSREIGGKNAKSQAINETELYDSVLALAQGQCSEWIVNGDEIGLAVCLERSGPAYIYFDECRDSVLRAWTEDKYEAALQERIDSVQVERYGVFWKSITIK